MALSIVTFANLGEKKNLKTAGIVPVINEFSKRGELKQIVCQLHKNFFFKNTVSAIPKVIYYPLRAVEKSLGFSLSRQRLEELFDFFAARKLSPVEVILFHPAQFERTIAVAKRNESITMGVAVTAHPLFNKALHEEESYRLGLTDSGAYAGMIKNTATINNFDYIIAFSEFTKASYVEFGYPAEKIFVAPQDIDLNGFTPADKSQKIFKVLYVGYSTTLKGLHYLLDAWKELHLENAELIIAGGTGMAPPALEKRYEQTISENHSIQRLGDMPQEELKKLYAEASVLVLPSLSESLGRVTLEAMACAVPVITTENARGLVENGKTGFVVPIRDSHAIAEKIKYMYDHPNERIVMGKESRRVIEAKRPFGEAVYQIYREILKREHKL